MLFQSSIYRVESVIQDMLNCSHEFRNLTKYAKFQRVISSLPNHHSLINALITAAPSIYYIPILYFVNILDMPLTFGSCIPLIDHLIYKV